MAEEAAAPAKSKKMLMVVLAVVLVALGGGAFVVLGGGGSKASAAAESIPEPGETVRLDSLTVNLTGGGYLRVGLALELVKGKSLDPGAAEVDPAVAGAKALDTAIAVFGARTRDQLLGDGRETAKAELLTRLGRVYDGAVLDVFFTEFVMQ